MKMYTLKFFLIALGFTFVIPAANAQFDDVYYDPDNTNTVVDNNYNINDSDTGYSSQDDVTYYDNDEYQYYDDYDYYYSSRIKRFYRPSYGAEFYDPYYVDSYNYDPFYNDSYYYPGATIYLSFGNSSYWDYRNWRRWNRWNSYHHFNNWCLTPTNYYYAYNNWCSPSYNYWGGYNGYYSYSNYYNNYYNSCPYPVSNYYGITHSTVTNVNTGGTRGTYYGPRITGNTGSSPRGPVANPGSVQPTYKDKDSGLTQSNDNPRDVEKGINQGGNVAPTPGIPGTEKSPDNQTGRRDGNTKGVIKDVPVDKEIKRENTSTTPTRPVFRPYPTNEKPTPGSSRPTSDKPAYTPESPTRDRYTPSPTQNRPESNPTRDNNKPSYTPRGGNERPSYTPPQRNNGSGNESRPSSPPTPRHEDNRSNDRPSYSPPPRNNDSGRSNDRSNASPSSGNHNSSNGGGNRSEPSKSSSPSSGNSPRGKG
ncbi:MAG: hypothetical protein IPP15_17775 [Saprospiraceae bacterium]|uniref:Uncharacterized protein n=1 Tax=Candidatus Opimibacter skivensis TaxID=2982028 RepID=A0A9D7XQH8_9BACT|nr:hypothetical protein [Candidatus Opimibacter skivensis]